MIWLWWSYAQEHEKLSLARGYMVLRTVIFDAGDVMFKASRALKAQWRGESYLSEQSLELGTYRGQHDAGSRYIVATWPE